MERWPKNIWKAPITKLVEEHEKKKKEAAEKAGTTASDTKNQEVAEEAGKTASNMKEGQEGATTDDVAKTEMGDDSEALDIGE